MAFVHTCRATQTLLCMEVNFSNDSTSPLIAAVQVDDGCVGHVRVVHRLLERTAVPRKRPKVRTWWSFCCDHAQAHALR